MRQLRRWKGLWRRSLTRSHKRTSIGAFQKLLERYKCIATGGDYFEGESIFMCVLSIKVPIRKKAGNLFNDPRTFVRLESQRNVFRAKINLALGNLYISRSRKQISLPPSSPDLPLAAPDNLTAFLLTRTSVKVIRHAQLQSRSRELETVQPAKTRYS